MNQETMTGSEWLNTKNETTHGFKLVVDTITEHRLWTLVTDADMDSFVVEFDCDGLAEIQFGEMTHITLDAKQLRRLAKMCKEAEEFYAQLDDGLEPDSASHAAGANP